MIDASGVVDIRDCVALDQSAYVIASRGPAYQIAKLAEGQSTWVSGLSSSTGDASIGESMGLVWFGQNLLFDARTNQPDPTLWRYDIQTNSTTELNSTIVIPGSTFVIVKDDRVVFDCITATEGREVCVTDGTSSGTTRWVALTPGMGSTQFNSASNLGDMTLFLASGFAQGVVHEMALWGLDADGLTVLYNPWPGLNSSDAGQYASIVHSPHHTCFVAHDGVHGHEWHCFAHGELDDTWVVLSS